MRDIDEKWLPNSIVYVFNVTVNTNKTIDDDDDVSSLSSDGLLFFDGVFPST